MVEFSKKKTLSHTFNLLRKHAEFRCVTVVRHWTLAQFVMSALDTLIVTFQTQLSDVMETVVKTAMYEVTRLVEDGFLEEVKRRSQEVESLRMQLQWTEKKLSGQEGKEGGKSRRCVDCAKKDVDLSTDTAEERSKDQHDGKNKCT